mgnify:CR=1 FL=1
MAVITTDIVIEDMKREVVLDWLGKPENHLKLLQGAFSEVKEEGPGAYQLVLKTPLKSRTLSYRFSRVDEDHGGRRVHVTLEGKRVGGSLHYSLRTMKPSTHTLVTLHVDYDTGGVLGTVIDHAGLRHPYEEAWKQVLQNLLKALKG